MRLSKPSRFPRLAQAILRLILSILPDFAVQSKFDIDPMDWDAPLDLRNIGRSAISSETHRDLGDHH